MTASSASSDAARRSSALRRRRAGGRRQRRRQEGGHPARCRGAFWPPAAPVCRSCRRIRSRRQRICWSRPMSMRSRPPASRGLKGNANGDELQGGALGIGALAIGGVKYQTESGLFKKMIEAAKARALRFPRCVRACARTQWITTAVLIVAASGRALAASARRAGYRPLVIDLFGDADTLALAHVHVRLDDGLARGFTASALDTAIERIGGSEPIGVVWGTGFEDRPMLIARLAQRLPPVREHSRHSGAPERSASICIALSRLRRYRIPIYRSHLPRVPPGGWRSAWAARAAVTSERPPARQCADIISSAKPPVLRSRSCSSATLNALWYWALASSGRLRRRASHFVMAARYARPTSAQKWQAHLPKLPGVLLLATQLVGLNSADFLVEEDDFRLLEINPRPSATLDIYEPPGGSLFALHMAACRGELDSDEPSQPDAAATAIVYAERDVSIAPLDWPDWTADRPHTDTAIGAGEPLCTVQACAATATDARQLVETRRATVLTWTHSRKP